jgi:ribosomal 50S subunit-associated protein YjgA (DUF615 family)
MAIKSFNVQADVYERFSKYCKDRGLSMSRQVDYFMRSMIEDEPEARKEFLDRLDQIRQQKSIRIGGIEEFRKRFGMK